MGFGSAGAEAPMLAASREVALCCSALSLVASGNIHPGSALGLCMIQACLAPDQVPPTIAPFVATRAVHDLNVFLL